MSHHPRALQSLVGLAFWIIASAAYAQTTLTSVRIGESRLDLSSPFVFSYSDGVAFNTVGNSVSGAASAPVTAVALALAEADRPSSNSGCNPAQFADFPSGNIALIQRGGCPFGQKLTNAENAGASGVILFDQGLPGSNLFAIPTFDLGDTWSGSIPVVASSFAFGEFWSGLQNLAFSMQTQLYRGPREQALLRYCEANRANCALSVRFEGSDGEIWERHLNGDRRQVTASTYKTLMLIAYGQAVIDGVLSPGDVLDREVWGRYAIRSDGGAMSNLFNRLGQPQSVTVDQIMIGMMRESDNAAPDWLLAELGQERINAPFELYVDGFHDLPIPINAYLMLFQGRASEPAAVDRIVTQYPSGLDDPDWRAELFALFTGPMQSPDSMQNARDFLCAALPWRSPPNPCTFGGQGSNPARTNYLGQHFTRTTSRSMLKLTQGMLDRSLLSPELQAFVEPRFEWAREALDLGDRFTRYGFKGGSFGPNNICNSHGYAETPNGDRISYAFYIQNSLHSCGVGLFAAPFQQALAEDTAFRELLRNDIAFDNLFGDRFQVH